MSEPIYQKIIKNLKKRIFDDEFPDMKLPDERSLAEKYGVSRSSIKRALNQMEHAGIVFKKRGAGTFINPLYLKNESVFNYGSGKNLGVSDNFQLNGQKPSVKVIGFDVMRPSKELQRDLFLDTGDFVYRINRLRFFDKQPFMIETGYIPIKLLPKLSNNVLEKSLFEYVQKELNQSVSKSFMSVFAEPSGQQDQQLLKLHPNEPVGVMEGIFFLDNGTPFEFSRMRLHYKYMKFNSFVSI